MTSVALIARDHLENGQTKMSNPNNQSNPTINSQPLKPSYDPSRYYSSSTVREYITIPGEDDSKRALLPVRSSSNYTTNPYKNEGPLILKDMNEVKHHLELMHDRCIARNLRAAGLGGFDYEEEAIYGNLDPNARLKSGETILTAIILYMNEPDRMHHYVSILLNDGTDVNIQDTQGKTALVHAIINKKYKAAKSLLRHNKTDLLLRDNDGNTALMHAASAGAEMVLYRYFKALRKQEKRQRHQSQVENENEKSNKEKDTGKTSRIVENGPNDPNDHTGLWSLLRSDDPLDIQNSQGETAHVLALKHGHIVCANMISDEKVRRAKETAKRLYAINHNRGAGSPSIIRLAKRQARRYFHHYGSFDSLYFDRDDDSDDELMLTASHMRRSRTVEAGIAHVGGPKPTPAPVAPQQNHYKSIPVTQDKKGLLVKLNKRFQSNPDILRVKTGVNCIQATAYDVEETKGKEINEEGKEKEQAITAPLKEQEKDSQLEHSPPPPVPEPPVHQPVIKRTSTQSHQRRQSASSSNQTQKRNLAEKLMSFFGLRSKCMPAHSNKKNGQQSFDFYGIGQEDAGEVGGNMRRGYSQNSISARQGGGRRASSAIHKIGERTASEPKCVSNTNQRNSMDATVAKYLAQSNAQHWPDQDTVQAHPVDPIASQWPD